MNLEIMQVEELQKLCKKLNELEEKKQSHDKLIECLNEHYNLSEEDSTEIKKLVDGKKKTNTDDEKEFEDIKSKLTAYCTLLDIKGTDEDGKIIEYKKLKIKLTNKLSKLRKDLKPEENKDSKTKNKEVDTNLPIATKS